MLKMSKNQMDYIVKTFGIFERILFIFQMETNRNISSIRIHNKNGHLNDIGSEPHDCQCKAELSTMVPRTFNPEKLLTSKIYLI